MKRTLTVLAVAASVIGLSVVGVAQGAGPRGGAGAGGFQGGPGGPGGAGGFGGMRKMMQEMHEKILAKLNLTPKQKKEVAALDKKRDDARDEMRKSMKPGVDRESMRPKMKKIQDDYTAGMKKTLTKEQYKKYEDLMKAQREQLMKMRGGMGGPGGPGGRGPGGGKPGGGKGGL